MKKNPPISTANLLPMNLPDIAIGRFVGSSTSGGSQYSATTEKEFEALILPAKTSMGFSAKSHRFSLRKYPHPKVVVKCVNLFPNVALPKAKPAPKERSTIAMSH